MNSERPDNDDVGPEDGAEKAGTPRDADDTTGPAAAEGASEQSKAPEAGAGEPAAEPTDVPEADEPAPEAAPEAASEQEEAPEAASEQAEAPEAPEVPEADERASEQEASADSPETDAAAAPGPGPSPSPDTDVSPAAGGEASASDVPDGGSRPRRRPALVAASVAAAVLLVGGGGAYLATSASGGSVDRTASGAGGDGTPPPLALDGYSEGGGSNGIAPGEPNPYGVTYRADGTLPDGPGTAPVYRSGGTVTEEQVAALAKALGVEGKPALLGQAWRVGAKDGSGPSLQVNRQAPGSWTFHRYVPGPDACQSETVCASDPVDPSADPVTEAAAKKAAAPVLKAVGQDDAKLDASLVAGAQRVVNADPEVGGMPTYGWTTGVTVGAQGEVVGANGQMKAPVKGDTYPVLSAEKTLGLMNAAPGTGHRMGIGGCASPVPLKDRLEAPCGESTDVPKAGKRETITVEKAVFGLAPHLVEGRQTLVPSWLFEVRAAGARDAYTVTHPAVDPTYLTSATPPARPSAPSAPPSAPGDEPTAAPATKDVQVEGYTAEGTELTVSFTGGVCADYKATAIEGTDEVTVTVTETPWPDKICIMIAKVYHQTVPLDEPLGDRKVVGADGKEIPLEKAGARLPETSGAR
ncbi:hypothetical protein [Streptomyces sp. AC555_RSS877]|uniref:hypothetical protein n=1 Tax=Streptomyces sp. AC555_RSS877 TaxID=2823688 RepID=UPI001C25F2FB|nr:hypothetical protein [Streptomyces sp. AC555_RSS877]